VVHDDDDDDDDDDTDRMITVVTAAPAKYKKYPSQHFNVVVERKELRQNGKINIEKNTRGAKKEMTSTKGVKEREL